MTETIFSINGPVVRLANSREFAMLEMVHVGNDRLIGEVIGISQEFTTIQVYESTTSLKPGEPVFGIGAPLSITLGPGLLSNIFDGVERPLRDMTKRSGAFIDAGSDYSALDKEKKYNVTVTVKVGDVLARGQVYATCPEGNLIVHKCLYNGAEGRVLSVAPDGEYSVNETIVTVESDKDEPMALTLAQKWPIRIPRPVAKRLAVSRPLITGQRVIDTFFPIGKGGAAVIPGGFGTGKTMTQHQLAKWCDADIIVYIGCGERGNEMTQVLKEFGELIDPRTGKALTDRTILIANTSNMPVAAREASIYTGITLAEYYRDMGYHVAIMADSTSRWAEALREISGRLEEMPAEEGFPAYLPSRLAEFYERAGYVQTLSGEEGSVTIIGAVSPQGSDFSEPVTQNTKRFVRAFWGLDKSLAYKRHYPAINWMTSYSEYEEELADFYAENAGKDFLSLKARLVSILAIEDELMEIVRLIGSDILPDEQKLVIEISRVIRLGYLQQNAYHKDDTYVPLTKQREMCKVILYLYDKAAEVVAKSIPVSSIAATGLFEKLIRIKYDIPNDNLSMFDDYYKMIDTELDRVR